MAAQEGSLVPSAQVVGNAFVEQYYHILHQSPGLVHRFYQDSSWLSRPDIKGGMTTVTTMQAINDKILSLNYEDYKAEIISADAQESYEKGVIVLVTGCLTGKDNVRKKFTQTFFLAPQDKGYFVLNDVFRFVEDSESLQMNPDSSNGINENAVTADVTQGPELTHNHDQLPMDRAIAIEGEDLDNGPEVYDPSDKEEGSVTEDEVVVEPPPIISVQNEIHTVEDSAPVTEEDEPQKKTYASIVKVMKVNISSIRAYVPTNNVRPTPTNTDQQSLGLAKPTPTPEPSAPNSDNAPESGSVNEEAEGFSIYVRNLPFTAKPAQLEEAFKQFGPIKKNGIQVRSNKQGYCFGFVAFEMPSSVQSALEASPIMIGDRAADVEAKRANSRVGGSGRGRYPSGRGGFRSDSFKGRGNFGGGRGYGRNDFRSQGDGRNEFRSQGDGRSEFRSQGDGRSEFRSQGDVRSEFRSQGEFSGRPKGSSGRIGEGRVNQNGSRRGGGHQGGGNRSSIPA